MHNCENKSLSEFCDFGLKEVHTEVQNVGNFAIPPQKRTHK